MSRYRDLTIDIQDAIECGELTFAGIAAKFNVSIEDIEVIYDQMQEYEQNIPDSVNWDSWYDEQYEPADF